MVRRWAILSHVLLVLASGHERSGAGDELYDVHVHVARDKKFSRGRRGGKGQLVVGLLGV